MTRKTRTRFNAEFKREAEGRELAVNTQFRDFC